ncbi:MAG TPA: ABC transporter ATP-binding protein [Steroidobacteraceae bacterium]|nr:ABC transporter ATP-binding protein [Steroidobacteraceae bacterium]
MLQLRNVKKIYRTTEVETHALGGITLDVKDGEFVAIMGPSGCGKSTLLNILGLLDSPDDGSYTFYGEEITKHSEKQLTKLRRTGVGFVFQSFNLVEDLNVAENVEVSLLYNGVSRAERHRRVSAALERVGLSHRMKHLPSQLSGGQQQRVAIARALVNNPKLIMADEPTGNLDTENGAAVMQMLADVNSAGTTVVMVTHSLAHASLAKRTVRLLDGHVVTETLL